MKGTVKVLTQYLTKELGSSVIRENVVAPGAIVTDFGGGRTRNGAEINKYVADLTVLGRVGLPDDVGGIVFCVQKLNG